MGRNRFFGCFLVLFIVFIILGIASNFVKTTNERPVLIYYYNQSIHFNDQRKIEIKLDTTFKLINKVAQLINLNYKFKIEDYIPVLDINNHVNNHIISDTIHVYLDTTYSLVPNYNGTFEDFIHIPFMHQSDYVVWLHEFCHKLMDGSERYPHIEYLLTDCNNTTPNRRKSISKGKPCLNLMSSVYNSPVGFMLTELQTMEINNQTPKSACRGPHKYPEFIINNELLKDYECCRVAYQSLTKTELKTFFEINNLSDIEYDMITEGVKRINNKNICIKPNLVNNYIRLIDETLSEISTSENLNNYRIKFFISGLLKHYQKESKLNKQLLKFEANFLSKNSGIDEKYIYNLRKKSHDKWVDKLYNPIINKYKIDMDKSVFAY